MRRRYAVIAFIAFSVLSPAPAMAARVLRVGSYHGVRGQFRTIQAAVNAAKPGDWVLVGPGDYKTSSGRAPAGKADTPAGILITTAHVHLRGMDRNRTVIDGTKSGPKCSSSESDQNLGPSDPGGKGPLGLNGVLVYKANDVWVQNLTACNFLHGAGSTGNELWWNGGDGSGQVGGWGFYGSNLNATTTYFKDEATAAQYGIFSSNWSGGTWDNTYASNFNDSDYYIGACQQVCNQTVNHAWAQYSALGYSGSNSGGQLVVENSQFDHNQDGFDTNSQNGDNPPPQDGACPNGGTSQITHTHSCWVFVHNYVHDNNNPNIPSAGSAAAGPVGTGMSLSGARNDTVMGNRFVNNGAWGVIIVPYPDSGDPCTGGTQSGAACLYNDYGDAVLNNTFTNNGSFGNPTNGDIGWVSGEPGPTPCFAGNTDTGGPLTSAPPNIEQKYPTCDGHTVPTDPQSAQFTAEVLCDSQISLAAGAQPPCGPNDRYPRRDHVGMPGLPPAKQLPTMKNACAGVPGNPWCPGKKQKKHRPR
ncbi:MAG TPA: hypothetical protein VGY32_06345 [Solirubrobacteraceae bacterium]|nr:hypothetical protein [Solirubrobacteraceae bacterium]